MSRFLVTILVAVVGCVPAGADRRNLKLAGSDPGADASLDPQTDAGPDPTRNTGCESPEILSATASVEDGSNVASNLLDGDLDTRWSGFGIGESVELELSCAAAIDSIQIATYLGDERFTHFEIQTSPDGSTWTTVLADSQNSGETADFETYPLRHSVARYLRLVGAGSSVSEWNSYSEIRIENYPIRCTPNQDECGANGCGGFHPECVTGECVGSVCQDTSVTVLYQNDFEHRSLGKYPDLGEFLADWQTSSGGNRWQEFEVVADPNGSANKVGKFTFPFYDSTDFKWICWCGGCRDEDGRLIYYDEEPVHCSSREHLRGVGPSSGGGQWYVDLGGKHDELYVSYRVRFSPDFNAVSGGKLFGLYDPARACPACESTDCDNDGDADDFTSKLMFHRGHLSFYIYHFDKTNTCGDSWGAEGSNVMDGEWHTILFYTRMNQTDEYDGVARVWIDGVDAGSAPGLRFRVGDPSLGIGELGITTFFGGSSSTRCALKEDNDCGRMIPYSSQRDLCAVDPSDPCSDVKRYDDGTPYYFFAPRKTEHLHVDDIVAYF